MTSSQAPDETLSISQQPAVSCAFTTFPGTKVEFDANFLKVSGSEQSNAKYTFAYPDLLGVIVGVFVIVGVGVFVGVLLGVVAGVLVGVALGVLLGVVAGVLVIEGVGVLVGVFVGVVLGHTDG